MSRADVTLGEVGFVEVRAVTAFAYLQLHPRQLGEPLPRVARHPGLVLLLQAELEQPVRERLPIGVGDLVAQ
jgi:hypothetical protein